MSWVSGPSRTADLEMRQTIGVHGPKSVDLVVVTREPVRGGVVAAPDPGARGR